MCPNAGMCVCVAIWDDHCYFYKKGSRATDICKKMIARTPQALPEWRLKSETPAKGKLVTIPWPGIEAMKPDMDYHADNLEDIRFKFLSSRRNPKVSLAGGSLERSRSLRTFSAPWMAKKVSAGYIASPRTPMLSRSGIGDCLLTSGTSERIYPLPAGRC